MSAIIALGVILVGLVGVLALSERKNRMDRDDKKELESARETIDAIEEVARESYELEPRIAQVIIDTINDHHRTRRETGRR